jgi:Tfp pilus assembly protein PilN
MPLPQRVVDQLSNEPPKTPGWSLGILTFSGGLLFLVIFIYAGLTFGYQPYLEGQVSQTQNQIDQLSQQISPADQTNLINFYSQIANLQTLLHNHIIISNLFPWLEANTEPNVYYTSFSFSGGDQITLSAVAASEADVNQQLAIFQSSPEVESVVVSTVTQGQNSGWTFGLSMTINSSLLLPSSTSTTSTSTPSQS